MSDNMPEFDVQDIIDGGDITPQVRAWAARTAAAVLRGQGLMGSRVPADSEMTLNIIDLAEWIMTGRSSFDDVLTDEDVHALLFPADAEESGDPDRG